MINRPGTSVSPTFNFQVATPSAVCPTSSATPPGTRPPDPSTTPTANGYSPLRTRPGIGVLVKKYSMSYTIPLDTSPVKN